MKSMKKMLCLLLVAMLLVAAIPVAASASEYDATFVNYTVYFAVQRGENYAFSSAIGTTDGLSSDANDDAIRAAGASVAAAKGYAPVTKDAIVDRVAANGNPDIVHNVVYGEIYTYVDRTNKEVKYILPVTARPDTSTKDWRVNAKIYIDKEGTGVFVDTNKTVVVTLVQTTVGATVTYAMKENGGASVIDIQGALGANYANKALSVRMECPTGTDNVAYYVTVTGTNGSTGTNVPSNNGSNNNNNGVPGGSGSTIPNGNGSSSNGGSNNGGSTNNGGVGNSGYDFGTNGRTVNFMCDGKVVYSKLVKNDAELEVAKAEAVKAIQALGCYKFKGWK